MALKILVVDDEADVPLLMQQRFRKEIRENHIAFRFAGNGLEALQVLDKEQDIDIVLSDINMPEMDGLTLLTELTGRGPMPKTVMVSAYGDLDNIRKAMNRGAFDFVTKPIDFLDLQTTIDKTQRELAVIKQALKAHDDLVGVRRELQIAATIQRSLLPREVPMNGAGGRFDLFADMMPATEVGGDFYDYFMIDDRRMGFLVADVSGKGMAAAIYGAVSRTLLHAAALQTTDPGQCLQQVNDQLCRGGEGEMFVTVCYGILDIETGLLQYAKGGHPPPFIVGPSGVRRLDLGGGMMLGMEEHQRFEMKRETLKPGEFFVLYSDGVSEAMNEQFEEFSLQCLHNVLDRAPRGSCRELAKAIFADVATHVGNAPQSDDITVLALGYFGPNARLDHG
jgi:sigma-B regulation protein RsbU (phosphoserine phosphatase)